MTHAPPAVGLRRELEPVRPDADHALHPDPHPDVLAHPAAHDCDERVPLHETLELGARLGRRGRVLGPVDDRRQDSVEVEEEPRLGRSGGQLPEEFV